MQLARKSALAAAVAATAAAAFVAPGAAHAAALTPGDIMIYRAGDGTTDQALGTTSVWIDEYSPTGGLVQSFSFPTTDTANGAQTLTVGATVTTEGSLNFSADGKYLVFAGYRRDVTTANSPGSRTSLVAPRVIGRLALDGTTDASTVIKSTASGDPDLFSGSSVRDVASTDGQHFWVSGVSGSTAPVASGLVYVDSVGPSAVGTVLSTANLRGSGIYNGDLYVNSQTTVRKVTGGGLPTSGTVAFTNLASGLANSQNSVFFDLDPATPGVDTFYVGDGANGNVLKYSLVDPNADTWISNGTVAGVTAGTAGPFNIAGKKNADGSVTLYFTSTPGSPATTSSILNTLTDTSGFNAAPNGTFSTLATSALNTTFRGVAVVPTPLITRLAGDVNGDGFVNSGDINAFIFALSHDAAGFQAQYPTGVYGNADVNGTGHAGDTFVNAADINPFIQILSGSGEPGIAAALAAVPEPASLSLLALGATTLLARRRTRTR